MIYICILFAMLGFIFHIYPFIKRYFEKRYKKIHINVEGKEIKIDHTHNSLKKELKKLGWVEESEGIFTKEM